jgi:hypothetical protein
MTTAKEYEQSLLQDFIASFDKLSDMKSVEHIDAVKAQLGYGEPDSYGRKRWRPVQVATDPEHLEPLYSQLPARFPCLYERLVLSYRWADVDLQSLTLLANPPGTGLDGLLHRMSKDPTLWRCLRKAGYIQFGKGTDIDYDPVCFDIRSRTRKGRDARIVKIDHEQILCYERVKVIEELASSFEELVQDTIKRANLAESRP